MTQEERIQKLDELTVKVNDLVSKYNDLTNAETVDRAEIEKVDNDTAEAIGEYVKIKENMVFQECKDAENPMLHAVLLMGFPVLAVKDTMEGENKDVPHREAITKDRPIDLLKLQKFCGKNIGAKRDWYDHIQKFNFLMTLWVSQELEARNGKSVKVTPKTLNESYQMSKVAQSIDMGKNPMSKTSRLKALQTVVAAMLGEEYKPISKNLAYIDHTYAKRGREAHSVSLSNHRTLTSLVIDVCNECITHAGYTVDYKVARERNVRESGPVVVVQPAQTAPAAAEPAAPVESQTEAA